MSSLKRARSIVIDVAPAKRSRASIVKSSGRRRRLSAKAAIFAGPERKQLETYNSTGALTVAAEYLCNGIAEGGTAITREGRVVKFGSLEVKWGLSQQAAQTDPTLVSWAVVLDRAPNSSGSNIAWGTVFDTSIVTDAALAFKNTSVWEARFKILRRGMVVVGIPSGGNAVVHGDIFINLAKEMEKEDSGAKYSGTGATITSIATNALYFMMCPTGQTTFADGTAPQITVATKLRFTDM